MFKRFCSILAVVALVFLLSSDARLGAVGISPPPVLVTAEQVARGKPDPEGFLRGAAALGLDPARCVAFEDAPAGVAAARSAGMPVVGVGSRIGPDQVSFRVSTLREVRVTLGKEATFITPASSQPSTEGG